MEIKLKKGEAQRGVTKFSSKWNC